MTAPIYPASLDVSAGQPTSYLQYNRLRADALRFGAVASDAVPLGQFLNRYISGLQLVSIPTNRLRVPVDPLFPPTLMINGYMCQAAAQVDLPSNSFSGPSATWYVFANRVPGSSAFTLSVNTNPAESVDQRLIGSCRWDGLALDDTSIVTYQGILGGSRVEVITLHGQNTYTTSTSYNGSLVCRQRLNLSLLKQGAKTAYLVANLIASSGTAYARLYDTTNSTTIIEMSSTSTALTNIIKSGDLISALPGAEVETRFEIKSSGSRVDCTWAALTLEY